MNMHIIFTSGKTVIAVLQAKIMFALYYHSLVLKTMQLQSMLRYFYHLNTLIPPHFIVSVSHDENNKFVPLSVISVLGRAIWWLCKRRENRT